MNAAKECKQSEQPRASAGGSANKRKKKNTPERGIKLLAKEYTHIVYAPTPIKFSNLSVIGIPGNIYQVQFTAYMSIPAIICTINRSTREHRRKEVTGTYAVYGKTKTKTEYAEGGRRTNGGKLGGGGEDDGHTPYTCAYTMYNLLVRRCQLNLSAHNISRRRTVNRPQKYFSDEFLETKFLNPSIRNELPFFLEKTLGSRVSFSSWVPCSGARFSRVGPHFCRGNKTLGITLESDRRTAVGFCTAVRY